nr:uncharacterized protein LOC106620202 [Bactrocera oleae]
MQWRNFIAISVLLFTAKTAATLDTEAPSDFGNRIQSVLLDIQAEKNYRTIFLQRRQAIDCVDPNVVRYFNTPYVIWNASAYGDLLYDYGEHIVVVLCLASIDDEEMLRLLSENIRYMRPTRILALLNENLVATQIDEILRFFEICGQLDLINVLLLHRDTFVKERYHSYTKFPSFALEVHNTSKNLKQRKWFPDRLKDLFGKNLTVLPDLHSFHTFVEINADGVIEMCGSLARFAQNFAEFMNASLVFHPNFTTDDDLDFISVRKASQQGLIDCGIAFKPITYGSSSQMLDITKLSVAVPIIIVPPMTALFYAFVKKPTLLLVIVQTTMLNILLSKCIQRDSGRRQFRSKWSQLTFIGDTGVRSILGQPLSISNGLSLLTQYVYYMLLFAGMIFQTYFAANYSQLKTFPPLRPRVSTYEEAVETGFQICTAKEDFVNCLQYSGIFIEDRLLYRKPFDLSSEKGYVVNLLTWDTNYSEQSISKVIDNMDISDLKMLALRLPEYSIFKQPLDNFTATILQSGLYSYWKRNPCVGNSVKFQKISYDDLHKTQRPLRVVDLHGVWLMYCGAIIICIFVFVCEVLVKLMKQLKEGFRN